MDNPSMELLHIHIHPQLTWGYQSQQAFLRTQLELVTSALDVDAQVVCGLIDQCLRESFEIHTLPQIRSAPHIHETLSEYQYSYLSRLAHLSQVLLQDLKVPTMDRAILINCVQDANLLKVELGIAWVTYIPHSLLELAVRLAHQGLELMLHGQFESERDAYFAQLQNELYQPWMKRVPGGKSTFPLLLEAYQQGHPITHLGLGIYQIGWGSQSLWFDRSATNQENAISLRLADHKWHTTQILRNAGLPVPRNHCVSSLAQAQRAAKHLGFPVVIKPAQAERGEGVSVAIRNHEQVEYAFEKAKKISPTVVVESYIEGICHRIAVYKDTFLYGSLRRPRTILADGQHTIAELIQSANENLLRLTPPKRLPLYPADHEAQSVIQAMDYEWHSVPPKGALIPLRNIQSTAWGGSPEDISTIIHPENIALAIVAAKALQLKLAGVDLITTDITRPYYETGARINEVNFSPVLGRTYEFQRRGVKIYVNQLMKQKPPCHIYLYVGSHAKEFWERQLKEKQSLHECLWGQYLPAQQEPTHANWLAQAGQALTHTSSAVASIKHFSRNREIAQQLAQIPSHYQEIHILNLESCTRSQAIPSVNTIYLCEAKAQHESEWHTYCTQHYGLEPVIIHSTS